MTSKVKVLIDGEALKTLIGSDFNLCLTRDVKVGPKILKGNVVFSMVPTKHLAPEWDSSGRTSIKSSKRRRTGSVCTYSVIDSLAKAGVKVTSGTKFVDIELGQKVIFDAHGYGKVTGEGDQTKPLGVRNDWKEDARVGIRSFDPTTDTYNALFLSPQILTDMTSELTPIKKFSIFWHQHLITDTIIDETVSDPYVFEMTGDEITIKYAKDKPHWSRV
ncbi:hypothetical protein F5887DRAFT_1176323 [Amanita rubescens]|nr:hypothetical protein F5887DRAFT_1176323 [Amanita rubescens]